MKRVAGIVLAAILCGTVPALAQNATAEGAARGAATGGSVAGPVGSFVGGVTGAAVGTAAGVVGAVTSPFRPRRHYYGRHGYRRTTCITRPDGTRRCRTRWY